MVAAVGVATCRLGDIIGKPQGALLFVEPAVPESLKAASAFGSTAPRTVPVNIENKGDGDLRWSAHTKHASSWATLDPDTGTAGQTPTLQVIFDPSGLDSGVYEDTVIVSAVSGTASFEVPLWFDVHSCDTATISLDDSVSSSLTTADCDAPHRPGHFGKLYRFSGIVNDSVSVEMVAGFDAFVAVDSSLAANQAPLAQGDNCLGTPGDPCLYYNRLPRNATYYVEVTSADSADTGSFKVRLLHPRPPDAPTSLDQRLNDSVTSVPVGNTVTALSLLLRGVVSDPDLGDTLHLEAEVRPINVGFSGPNVPNGPKVGNGQVAWVSTGTLSDKTSYHWRIRAGDNTGRQGLWASLPGGTHFTINVPHAPDAPTALAQSKPDGTPINVGGVADTDVVVFSASVSDQDPGDQLRLQVEVKPVGQNFNDSPTDSSPAVSGGGAAQVSIQNGNNTNYHWQARVTDQTGLASSPWTKFGNNAESATDFRIQLANVPNAPDSLAQYLSDGTTVISIGGATPTSTVVLKGKVSDPDVGQTVQLDVEVRAIGTDFTNSPTNSSSLVTNNTTATVTVGGLAPNTCYHWQARAKDNTGRSGAWRPFPTPTPNPELNADFCVQQPPTELFFNVQPPTSTTAGVVMAPALQVYARDVNHNLVTTFTGNVVMTLESAPGATLSGTTSVPAVGGVATFSNLFITKSGSGYVLRATTTVPSLTQPSNAFTITPAATSQLVFTTNPPPSTTAGAAMTPALAVTAEDNFGNTTPLYSTGVTLSIAFNAGNPPGTLSGSGPVTPVNGVATFPAVSINKIGNGYLLQAASGSLKPDTSTAFNITPGAVTKVAFQVQPPASAPANTPISPTIQVAGRDANDNLVSSFIGNAALAITAGTGAPGAVLSGGGSTAAVGGVASFPSAAIDLIGSGYTLTATSSGLASAASTSFMIVNSPVSPTLSSVTANPTTITACSTGCTTGAGTASIVTVTARDGGNNPVAGVSATLTAPGATISPAGSQNTNASGVATWTLTATASGAKALSATISLVSITDTATVNVSSALPATLNITTQPTNTVAGAAINNGTGVVVTARDAFGNTATSFTSVVTMAIAAGPVGGTLAPTSVNTATAAAGVANFPGLRIYKAGSGYQLQATGGALPPSILSSAFTINTAPLVKLGFIMQPGTSADSAPITPAPQVAGQDSVGNTVAGFTALVRMFIGQPGGGGTLSGTTSTNAVSGVATFSNLRINAMGTGYTLLTTSTGLASDESVPFDIIAGPASKLVYSVQPPLQTVAGAVMSPTIQVTAQDNQGNTATSFTGSVTLAIAAGTGTAGAILSGGGATATAGVATFPSASIDKAGTGYRLNASATGLTGATSNLFDIVSGGVSAVNSTIARNPISITASAPTAPITSTITVTAKDGLGNPISSLPVVLSATGSLNNLTQPAPTDINGQATGTISSTVAESKTISATINGTLINATTTVTVNPAAAKQLVFVSQPTSTAATQIIKSGTGVTVEVRDTFNNRVTAAGNSVNVSILNNGGTPVPGTLSGTTPRTPSAGVVTFNDLSIDKAGPGYTMLASSTGLVSDTSTGFPITVGAATHVAFVQQPTQTAGGATIAPAVTVEILDAGGNRVNSSANVTVALGNNPGSLGTLGGTLTAAASSGLASFSTLNVDHAATGYTLVATSGSLTQATSSAFNIVVGAPAKLVFGQQPTSAVAGVAISPAVTVRVLDPGNNLVTTATNSVTMAILNNASGGTLSGTTPVSASGGVATFSDLSIDKAGTGYTLRATSGSLTGVTSTGFDITHAGADHLVFTVQPANTQAGQTMPSVVVQIRDAFDNLVTNGTDQVTLAITNGTGTPLAQLSGTNPKAAVGGVATFADLSIDLAGIGYTLDATASGMTGTTSGPFNITP